MDPYGRYSPVQLHWWLHSYFLFFGWANRIGLWSQVTLSSCLGPRWLSHQEGRINMEPPTTWRPATSRAAWTARPFLIRTISWTSATWTCGGIGNLFSNCFWWISCWFLFYRYLSVHRPQGETRAFYFWGAPGDFIPRLPRAAKGLGGAKGKLLLERPLLFQFLTGVEGSALRSAAADALLWGGWAGLCEVQVVNSTTKPTRPTRPTDGKEISPLVMFQPGFTTLFSWGGLPNITSLTILWTPPSRPWAFRCQEILMTVRLFTHGWDLFSPCEGLVFHLWQRDYRRVYAEDMKVAMGWADVGGFVLPGNLWITPKSSIF